MVGGKLVPPITQTSVKFFALFPAMSISVFYRKVKKPWVCSVLLSQLLCCRRKTDLCGAFRFMCFVQISTTYYLDFIIASSIFNFQSMARITRLSTLFCGKCSLSNNMLVNHVHLELLLIRIQPLHSIYLHH